MEEKNRIQLSVLDIEKKYVVDPEEEIEKDLNGNED